MPIQCLNLQFFSAKEDLDLLLTTIGPIFRIYKTSKYDALFNLVIKALKDLNTFKFGKDDFTSRQQEIYSKSISELKEALINFSKARLQSSKDTGYINSFINLIDSEFEKEAGITSDDVTTVEQPSVHIIEGINDDLEEERKDLSFKSAIDEMYKTSYGARQQRDLEFGTNILKATIIDTQKDIVVSNNDTLNEAIGNYKNSQYANIVKFLKSENPEYTFSEELYDEDGIVTPDYYKVMNLFYTYTKNKDNFSEIINRCWLQSMSEDKPSLLLEATHSYINLQYFDDLLEDKLGNVVQLVNKDLKGSQLDIGFNKYIFGKVDEHKVKHWGTNDTRDALKNIARFSKLSLSIIPVYSTLNGKYTNEYVNIQKFSSAITGLFNKLQQLNTTEYKSLRAITRKFHSNPYYYAPILFKQLSELKQLQGLIGDRGFTRLDYDILMSVYKAVYDLSNEHSIMSIETKLKKKNFLVGRYSIVDCINGVIDRTMLASYLLTVYNNNQYETSIKTKSNVRQSAYNLINQINQRVLIFSNSDKLKIINKYKIQQIDKSTIVFSINGIAFKAKFGDGVLSNKNCEITCTDNATYRSIFNPKSLDIDFSPKSIQRIILNKGLSKKEQLFRETLQFIDDFLGLNLLSENGLTKLNIYKSLSADKKTYIHNILQYSIKAAAINNYQYQFLEQLDAGNYQSKLQFEKFMDLYFGKGVDNKTKRNTYFLNNNGNWYLRTVGEEAEWIDGFCLAEAILTGEVLKSTTKNLSKSSIGNYRTSFLGGNIEYYCEKYRELKGSAIGSLLFTLLDDLIRDIVIDTDIQARNGEIKDVRNMKVGELIYSHIIHNFFGTFVSDNPKNKLKGCFVIQPTTFADKVTPINYAIDGNKKLFNGKTLAEMNTDETIDLYLETIGKGYMLAYNNILNLYRKLFNQPIATEQLIREILRTKSEKQLLAEVSAYNDLNPNDRIELIKEVHYRKNKKGGLLLNELYYHNARILTDKTKLVERLNKEKIEFIRDIINSGVQFYTSYASDNRLKNLNHPILKILNSSLFKDLKQYIEKDWMYNGKLIIAKTLDGQNIFYNKDLKDLNDIVLNPILEKFFYTEILLSNNIRFGLTGTESAHPDKSKVNVEKELSKLGINIYNAEELGLVEDIGGKKVITNDIIKLAESADPRVQKAYNSIIRKIEAVAQGTQFKRNVIIPGTLQYNQMNVLNGIPTKLKVAVIADILAPIWNFRGDGSGPNPKTEDAHDGSAWINPFVSILENMSLQDQEVGVDKKPIWHSFDPNTMSAVLLKFAAFTMTNERMRTSMKSDVSLYKLFKQMTNMAWFNKDGSCNFTKPKNMSDQRFNEAINKFNLLSTIGFKSKGKTVDQFFIDNILQNEALYYKQGDTHYQIEGFGYDENGYYTREREALINGNPRSLDDASLITYYHKFSDDGTHYKFTLDLLASVPEEIKQNDINSLFQLFNVFGGIYSESLVNGELKFSEKSSLVVVNFMNNISIRTTDKNTSQLDLTVYYQPLKDMMISYAANPSAMKVGVANLNATEKWNGNEKLDYMTMDADGLGIQMDADHEMDEAEMTEFSLVISALEAGGRLHEVANEVYRSLGQLAIQASSIEIDAVSNFIKYIQENDKDAANYQHKAELLKSAMYDVVGRALINNYRPNNERFDLAKPIINEISKTFNIYDNHILAPLKLAFSDSNLFDTVISTFMSTLNKKSIKRQYSGSGCVMVPGYNIIQIFRIGGVTYQYDDLVDKAYEVNRSEKFFKEYNNNDDLTTYNYDLVSAYLERLQLEEYRTNAKLDLSSFIPTDIVDVLAVLPDGSVTKIGKLDFNQIDFYYKCKFKPNFLYEYLGVGKETQLQFAQSLTSPRNLAPAKMTWLQNGKYMNIFDTEEVANSFGYTTKNYLGTFNLEGIDQSIYDIKVTDEPRKDRPDLMKYVLHIGLKGKNIGEFTLVADTPIDNDKEFTGTYSLHLKTATETHPDKEGKIDISTPQERALLYDAVYKAIPVGAELSTFGGITEGGVKALSKFGKRFTQVGTREISYKDGTPVEIGIYRKSNQDRDAIQKVFDDLDKGLYHGEEIQEFHNTPAELIMSNLYASKFGIDLSLPEVLEAGSSAFKKYTLPKIGVTSFDFAFTTRNNDNVYFTFGEVKSPSLKPKKENWRYKIIDNKVYHTNKEGEIQFLVGALIARPDISYDSKTESFFDGKLIIKNNPNLKIADDGSVLEYIEYITQYKIFEKVEGKINSYKIYKIDKKNVKHTLQGDSINEGVNDLLGDILSQIYTNSSFNGIRLNSELTLTTITQALPVLSRMIPRIPEREGLLLKITNEYLKDIHNVKSKSIQIDDIEVKGLKKYSKFLLDYYNQASESIYSSFLKSLQFTASRIPAQTLQSFMQMRLVGFTKSSKNICYVSHWLTYLQGSDYDIDKAYIMGLELDDNGMYIGWSNLFNYSTLSTLEASEQLPIPKKVKYSINENGVDISEYIAKISDALSVEDEIIAYANLLKFLDKQPVLRVTDENGKTNKLVYIKFDPSFKEKGQEVLTKITKHANTNLTGDKLESAIKNSISSRIQKIILNPRNMDLAYTSIDGEMDRIRKAAENSPKGNRANNMTMLNPLTKIIMLVSNMVGKGVIGIAATGEKVYFNLSNYWNEGIRSGDKEWLRNLKFENTFSRIDRRSKGMPVTKVSRVLANTNFENVEEVRLYFANVLELDKKLRNEYNVSDSDVINNTENYQLYKLELIERVKLIQDSDQFVDLNISALLSAATDNAKELILDKINASTDLARCYIHLIMLGYSLNDIASFMTSSAVSLVNEISDANVFDEYLFKVSIPTAIGILQGDFPVNKFFFGTVTTGRESFGEGSDFSDDSGEGGSNRKVSKIAFNALKNLQTEINNLGIQELLKFKSGKIKEEDLVYCKRQNIKANRLQRIKETFGDPVIISETVNEKGKATDYEIIAPVIYGSLKPLSKMFFIARLKGDLNSEQTIESFLNGGSTRIKNNVTAFSYYVENIIDKILEASPNLVDFNLDLEEFNKLYKLSEETSTLGSTLLKLNQGLPVDEIGLIQLMLKIQNAFNNRFNEAISDGTLTFIKDPITKKLTVSGTNIYSQKEVNEMFNSAVQAGIITENGENMFDVEKWISDDQYRKATSDFYNIIKGTWNIFDVINRLPHFNAIFGLLRMSIQMNNNLIRRSHTTWLAAKKLFGNDQYVSDLQIEKLQTYINNLIILDWINHTDLTTQVLKDDNYFIDSFEKKKSTTNGLININSEAGRATFKLQFELMIESLKNGTYKDLKDQEVETINDPTLASNPFIKNLVSAINDDGAIYYKLNIDMLKIASTLFNSKNYQECLDGFLKLKNYQFNGKPLTDWFMLYNFIVNKNMWGSDRLTSLFGPFIDILGKENSLIKQYFSESGENDWSYIADLNTIEDLEKIGFNEDDAYYAMAPVTSELLEVTRTEKMIKEIDENGNLIIKVRQADGSYRLISLLDNMISLSSKNEDLERQFNYMNYSLILTPFFNKKNAIVNILSKRTKDLDTHLVELVLYDLLTNGVLTILKDNC